MARITVEDCLEKIDSQYDLVLLAKERTSQLNAGSESTVRKDNDKNTVISLREIGEGKISIKTLEDSAINKLRKIQNEPEELEDLEVEDDDDFNKIYKGEISKSGAAILPSKRVRKTVEKIISEPVIDNDKEKNKAEQTDQQLKDDSLSAENKKE